MSKKICFIIMFSLVFVLAKMSLTNLDETPEVVFCDVGQGDATLVQKGTFQLLIDTGPDASVNDCLDNNMPFGDRTLDWVIITHPHADHYQGLPGLLQNYRVANLMIDAVPQDDNDYLEAYHQIMSAVEIGRTQVHSSQVKNEWRFFDDLAFTVIYSPPKCSPEEIFSKRLENSQLSDITTKCTQEIKNINNASIGIILDIDHILFTFTGDAEQEIELALIDSELLRKTDVLKIPHHGSKSSSSPNFLKILEPKLAVISVGQKNSYGHPNADVLARLNELGTQIHRTDHSGEINFKVIEGNLQMVEK